MALSLIADDLLTVKESYDYSLQRMMRHVKDNPESLTGDWVSPTLHALVLRQITLREELRVMCRQWEDEVEQQRLLDERGEALDKEETAAESSAFLQALRERYMLTRDKQDAADTPELYDLYWPSIILGAV
ncbi:hypothetical protein KIPB_002897 [Kipferlia bialata]|uniref:Uncharacterized protein n=1 Tax=Kipferlia bialata TaxID=797122 RepID=A0A9K3CT12_9EUKA|nr:hypothetical protein KIPB_002897 [Kipferlia bialata]|eukprot:g2897.t1